MYCFKCRKDCRPTQYRVRFVNRDGETEYKDCCSIKCCQEIVDYYGEMHMERYKNTVNQVFQRLK